MKKIALVSVFNKENLLPLLKHLNNNNYQILSSGGTADYCKDNNIPVTRIQDYTGVSEMLGGRVKTLNHKVFAGILHKDTNLDKEEVKQFNIESIDIVVVNCYPFNEVANNVTSSADDVIENIDIGGPSLIRAAAKNHNRVTVVVDPHDYDKIINNKSMPLSYEMRKNLAIKAFSYTRDYDSNIYNYFSNDKLELRYGENPDQKASIVKNKNLSYHQHGGKEMSYNNFLDADTALSCVNEFTMESCVIVKHATPCGVACSDSALTSYKKAFQSDPISAFGGVIAFNCAIDGNTANEIVNNQFFELILAPEFSKNALEVLTTKKNARIISYDINSLLEAKQQQQIRSTIFGTLEQEPQKDIPASEYKIVSQSKPNNSQLDDLYFAWTVAKYIKSNGIVFAKNLQTIGIGTGQTSRIASSEFGLLKAKQLGLSTEGSVMASDGFFPFADNITTAANSGISAIIQPGGSIKDSDVIDTANKYNLVLIHTGIRQFRH